MGSLGARGLAHWIAIGAILATPLVERLHADSIVVVPSGCPSIWQISASLLRCCSWETHPDKPLSPITMPASTNLTIIRLFPVSERSVNEPA